MIDDNDTDPAGRWAGPLGPDLAAQLAEKEREIAKTLLTAQLWKGAAEQAEQRLKEATERPFCEGVRSRRSQ